MKAPGFLVFTTFFNMSGHHMEALINLDDCIPPAVSDSLFLEWDPRICVLSKFLGDAIASDLGIIM